MADAPPTYSIGDVVYLKESAALGFLEAVTISGIYRSNNPGMVQWAGDVWLYTVQAGRSRPTSVAMYGDRRSLISGATLYYGETEFVLICDALDMVEANLTKQLDQVRAQKAALCADHTG